MTTPSCDSKAEDQFFEFHIRATSSIAEGGGQFSHSSNLEYNLGRVSSILWMMLDLLTSIRFVLVFLLQLSLPTSSTVVAADTISNVDILHDQFCSEQCSSLSSCNELYNNNFVDLRLRVNNFPIDDGPGKSLVFGKDFGTTISRQTFETQFILDIAAALDSSPCHFYIISVLPEGNDNYWDSKSVFVTFRLFPVRVDFVSSLTKQLQEPESVLHDGLVTRTADSLYGLVALPWDFTLKLTYSISIVGDVDVIHSSRGRYLNQGSLNSCVDAEYKGSRYCIFERYLVEDIERALSLEPGQFTILFIKEADRQSVAVTFRLIPMPDSDDNWAEGKGEELVHQMSDPKSLSDAYERCKATRRCPRAWSSYNQSSSESSHTLQAFRNGQHSTVPLFLDFEDWRQGTRGWKQSCRRGRDDICLPTSLHETTTNIAGAHWNPFDFESLGPSIPAARDEWNNGLEYKALVHWMDEEFQHGLTDDASIRSREEIRMNITDYSEVISSEELILDMLTQSQCSAVECNLLFNTSDATLTGAVNATGVIATTPDGTEVALWAFDSIDIDENVNITLTGQRAMALVSRSSVRINATLYALPGTLGGFPGGFSVARRSSDRLVRVCNEQVDLRGFLDVCQAKSPCCPGDQPINELARGIVSNNVNGPGSPSTRVYLFTIQTSAPVVNEIQSLTSSADDGQTLSGGFRLHFNNYTTSLLPHDISAPELKRRIEDSLNPTKKNRLDKFDRLDSRSGIGAVEVTRDRFGPSGGFQWDITFQSAVGNIGKYSSQLTVTNLLVSKGADISLETIRHGNSIGGTFALQFLGNVTRSISHDVSATELAAILLEDVDSLSTVDVIRSDPTDNCNDGFCRNGPQRSGGYIWTLTLTTQTGNVSPFSPTSNDYDYEGEVKELNALNYLSGCVDSECPVIHIESGHAKSHNHKMRSIKAEKPFSLAYGGAGGGYGGKGGDGFGDIAAGKHMVTNKSVIFTPFQLGVFKDPRGRGGSGGGAIEIVAANDIVIGSNSAILCEGEHGADGYMSAGGGGSGGSILLAAGGSIQIDGMLSVTGGDGGRRKSVSPVDQDNSFGGHGGGGSGGRIALYGESVVRGRQSSVILNGGECSATNASQECNGERGTIHIDSGLDTSLVIDQNTGAAGTRRSLYLTPRLSRIPFNPKKLLSSTQSSPEYDLGASSRPGRVSFYYRAENHSHSKSNWDAAFELRKARWSYLSSKSDVAYTAVVGLFFGHDEVRHGVNYIGIPHDDEPIKELDTLPGTSFKSRLWSKVDILFDWETHRHDIYINDIQLVQSASFQAESIRAISLSNFHEGSGVWFDEIYVGDDTTMDFYCPRLHNGTLVMERPIQKGWKLEDVGGVSTTHPMQRHESHVSRRPLYQREDSKFIKPFDGLEDRAFTSDVKFRSSDGDRDHKKGSFLAGSLLRLPGAQASNHDDATPDGYLVGKRPDTYTWYGEHDYSKDLSSLAGGIMACSTQDFVTWKNEGVMLNFANLTDMVDGSSNMLRAEKPKVLYNNSTQKYVMWMIIDNGTRELGMAGVAVSDYHSGPFEFVRSFYPDGNQTRDQTLFQDNDGAAYLFRTYYATVDYVTPEAAMQPTWESVKNSDGSTNFALSYHRAEYDSGYDDYHDIYLQRWRTEDKPWQVICVNRITKEEREVPYGKEHLNFDGEVCQDPFEYKIVLGQGNPNFEESVNGIQSRFLDPNDPANNVWIPNSVPEVQGQTWKDNFADGTCGRMKVDLGMQTFDPDLPDREKPDRRHCSNLVDNPIHETQPDKRIGDATVLEQRRAKYVAVSRLTDDYLDTSGILHTYEGELTGDLSSIVRQFRDNSMPFGWSSGEDISSTFHPQRHDYQFSQTKAKQSDIPVD
ncbi:glycosyl hydrolase (family 43) [Skeletonema marinoi]|uniref:Glycosyl hydrolase (Family 43) n=1 Tax=Skeletonema marinoi TaxID=267567 RepID=A0AAD8Y4D4_9STRA|nr:glycosyl hydrolase (family 43) [Skeletonema marinoi]